MPNLSAELRAEVEALWSEGETRGGNVGRLSTLYQRVFNAPLNTACKTCVEEATGQLKKLLNTFKQPTMKGRYEWTSNPTYTESYIMLNRVRVDKSTLNDTFAELILNIPKYAHLVQPVQEDGEGVEIPEEVANATYGVHEVELSATTSTDDAIPAGEPPLKKRRRKPKLS